MATYRYGDVYLTDTDGDYEKVVISDRDCSSAILSGISMFDDRVNSNNIRTGKFAYTGSMKSPELKMLPEIEKVIFNDPATVVIWSDGTKTIYFPIGSKEARTSEGQTIAMDTSAVIKGGRTFAPIRALAEYFGYTVDWDGAARTVIIK